MTYNNDILESNIGQFCIVENSALSTNYIIINNELIKNSDLRSYINKHKFKNIKNAKY